MGHGKKVLFKVLFKGELNVTGLTHDKPRPVTKRLHGKGLIGGKWLNREGLVDQAKTKKLRGLCPPEVVAGNRFKNLHLWILLEGSTRVASVLGLGTFERVGHGQGQKRSVLALALEPETFNGLCGNEGPCGIMHHHPVPLSLFAKNPLQTVKTRHHRLRAFGAPYF